MHNSWEEVSALASAYGLELDAWQEVVLEAALGERADGTWASRQVGLSVPRQNGKTEIFVARALAGIYLFDEELIICSAHQQDTARVLFQRLVDVIEGNKSLADRLEPKYGISRSLNREQIRFRTGQTIQFRARSAGSGLGFSADCLLLDEAQILAEREWAAILPTLSSRPNAQAWLIGTPPAPYDDGAVFERLRATGLDKSSNRVTYLEWSMDANDDMDSPQSWAKANPAYGIRIFDEAIMAERASMSDDDFARMRGGMWAGAATRSVIPIGDWNNAGDDDSVPESQIALGVEVAPDLTNASISMAGLRSDGLPHIELVEAREGTDWIAPYVESLVELNPAIRAVAVDAGSAVSAIIHKQPNGTWAFKNSKVRVILPRAADLAATCSTVLSGVVSGTLKHLRQGQMTAAVGGAGKRAYGTDTGLWVWSRRSATVDITPLQAATLALWAAQVERVRVPPLPRSGRNTGNRRTRSNRRAVVL